MAESMSEGSSVGLQFSEHEFSEANLAEAEDSDPNFEPELSRRQTRSRGRGRGRGRGKGRGRARGNDEEETHKETATGRGRGRGKGRGRGRGRGRGKTVEPADDDRPIRGEGRGRGRGRGRGARGGARARSRNRMSRQDEERVRHLQDERKKELLARVNGLDEDEIRALLRTVLERQPGMVFDLLESQAPMPPQPPPQDGAPMWCRCRNCRQMPTDEERKCCDCLPQNCISKTPEMEFLVLDPWVLDVANRYRGDMLALNLDATNKSLRHGGYRQFTLWRHGRLGVGRRRVIPSCCVWAIRDRYPDSNGHYTGYQPNRLV